MKEMENYALQSLLAAIAILIVILLLIILIIILDFQGCQKLGIEFDKREIKCIKEMDIGVHISGQIENVEEVSKEEWDNRFKIGMEKSNE